MLLNGELGAVLIAVLWFPFYAVAGALYTVLARRAALRFGRRGLVASWALGALAVATISGTFATTTGRSWSNPAPVRSGLLVGAMMFIPAALCFFGPTLLIARRLTNADVRRRAGGVLAGATLTACTWVLVCAVAAISESV